jgi:vacuolar protein sorting-associated protein 51
VYDNYSKLISATETIRRMRANMDPLNPMAATLSPAIVGIYERAEGLKAELRRSMMTGKDGSKAAEAEKEKKERTEKETEVVRFVLGTPERLRILMAEGREEEAKKEWEGPVRLLRRWKERGVGGVDVDDCIEDGEAALRGEPPGEKSWVNLRSKR